MACMRHTTARGRKIQAGQDRRQTACTLAVLPLPILSILFVL
jgi:hypothetical protein